MGRILWFFRHNKDKAEKLFNIHLQFFETAKCAYNAGRLRVFVDIPLRSTELFVRSRIFVMSERKYMQRSRTTGEYERIQQVRKIRKHGSSLFRNLGYLSRLRDEGRYHKRPFSLEESEAQEYIITLKELAEDVRGSILWWRHIGSGLVWATNPLELE